MPIAVGVYARISDDTEDDAKGVKRQLEDCCGLAELRRWKAVPYVDNDVSAYQRKVKRPQFEQLLADLKAGVIKGMVVYNIDRGFRQPRDLERAIDIYHDHPDYVFATLEGDINLAAIDGRTMARVLVAFANKASADTGRRVKRKQLELATEGKPHGGRQAYGWKEDGVTADPDAKREILKGQRDILAGVRITTIRDDWVRRGIAPTSRSGKRFAGAEKLHHKTVQRILANPALAGLKVYKGEVVRGPDGNPVKAAWEPICTPEDIAAVAAELECRSSKKETHGGNVVKYLLSGIARCGACGSPMRGQTRKRASGSRYPVYLCDMSGYARGCGKIARQAEPVDKMIIKLVLADHERRKSAPAELPNWDGEERLKAVAGEIAELVEAKKQGLITVSTLLQLLPDLERERDGLALAKNRAKAEIRRATLLSADTEEVFDSLPIERQRAKVLQSLKAVVIHPQGKGVARFNPDLIEPLWAA
jgi:DNA invertase Pin-like site-specific DNA recombinase